MVPATPGLYWAAASWRRSLRSRLGSALNRLRRTSLVVVDGDVVDLVDCVRYGGTFWQRPLETDADGVRERGAWSGSREQGASSLELALVAWTCLVQVGQHDFRAIQLAVALDDHRDLAADFTESDAARPDGRRYQ